MLEFRRIDVKKDRETLLELHCRINYESETPIMRSIPYEDYREKWLSTSQPKSFLSELEKTMNEDRTIGEILEDNSSLAGYLWVTFADIKDYNITIAQIMDIAVSPFFQRQGIGTIILKHIQKLSREHGATLIRSDTGIENTASQKLHEGFGFKPYRISYEKTIQ